MKLKSNSSFLYLNCLVLALWVLIRVSYRSQILHQDEYKWALFLENGRLVDFPHPILSPFVYHLFLNFFGIENLRLVPIIISFLGHVLAVLLVYRELGYSRSLIFNLLLTLNPFVILGNYQIDIDGSFLFFFIVLYVYISTDKSLTNFKSRYITSVIVILGILTKFSFILILVAHLLSNIKERKKVKVNSSIIYLMISLATILIIQFIQPLTASYSGGFIGSIVSQRNTSQIIFLTAKSLLWLGPILFFIKFNPRKRNLSEVSSLFNFYIVTLFLFYFILFNFSDRAFDRYLLAFCLPVIYLAVEKISKTFKIIDYKNIFFILIFVSLVVFLYTSRTNFEVIPLHPKQEFVSKIFTLDFNFLIPFFTGSGPIGFYVPFSLLFASFFLTLVCIIFHKSKTFASLAISSVLLLNLFFLIESTTGYFFGSASKVAKESIVKIPAGVKTITYNDIGGYELHKKNSYFKRVYLNPSWRNEQQSKFENYQGLFLLIDMPAIDNKSWLLEELKKCNTIYSIEDKKIRGAVFTCDNLKDEKSTVE